MRNRTAPTPPGISPAHPQEFTNHVVLHRMRDALVAAVGWFRAGYPEDAPRTGHSPLLALYGPPALTTAQKDHVSKELDAQHASDIDIAIAITKATNRLPTPTQTRSMSRALRHRDYHQ
jgi:hypothetical protein